MRHMYFAFLVVLVAFVVPAKAMSVETAVAAYARIQDKIKLGDKLPRVQELYDATQGGLPDHQRRAPETYLEGRKKIDIIYFRHVHFPDGRLTDDELQPHIFEGGKLVAIGWQRLYGGATRAAPYTIGDGRIDVPAPLTFRMRALGFSGRRDFHSTTTSNFDITGTEGSYTLAYRRHGMELSVSGRRKSEDLVDHADAFETNATRFAISWLSGYIPSYVQKGGTQYRVQYAQTKYITRQDVSDALNLIDAGNTDTRITVMGRKQFTRRLSAFGAYGAHWTETDGGGHVTFGVGVGLTSNLRLDVNIESQASEADDETASSSQSGLALELVARF